MKFTKLCLMFTAATLAVGAFADAANVLVSFWSTNDTYADGSTVKEGEWYALCWSPNETFGGITYDYKPVVDGDVICDMMPRAVKTEEGVGCKFTVFQADSSLVKDDGNFFVYLLDTRDVAGNVTKDSTTTESGLRVPDTKLSGVSVSASFTAEAEIGKNNAVESDLPKSMVGWFESDVPADKCPRVVGFKLIDDAKVELKVADMLPGVKYNVKMGSNPAELTTYALKVPQTVSGEGSVVPFEVSKGDASFFQVIRQPLKVEE